TYFTQRTAARSSIDWMVWNAAIEVIKSKTAGYLRVRYEDFISDPRRELNRILNFLGQTSATLPLVGDRDVWLEPQHTIAGNPSRFLTGRTTIRLDDSWREEMATAAKGIVTAVTAPLLLRYRYPVSG